jgi:predicted O-linked N-acetylglucosamine transferase (SPINDLY family)
MVTLTGKTFASRVAFSLLQAVGQEELARTTADDYESLAISLATDDVLRKDLRKKLYSARESSALFDGAKLTRDIERLYERMWERALAGTSPDHLAAQPFA